MIVIKETSIHLGTICSGFIVHDNLIIDIRQMVLWNNIRNDTSN